MHIPAVIRDLNILYLQVAQQLTQEDLIAARFWLGVDSEMASSLKELTPLAIRELASKAGVLLYVPRNPSILEDLLKAAQSGDIATLEEAALRALVQAAQAMPS